MENDRKDRLLLLLIFGPIAISAMYINNTVIDGISFRDVVHRYIPVIANYNPVTVGLIFIIICFVLAFLCSDKSIPSKHQDHSGNSRKPKPIVQDILIRPVLEQPVNSSGHVKEQVETRLGHIWTQKTYHSSKPRKKRPVIRNYYDRRNRHIFKW